MREEEGSWFARWEEELPSPEELMPLSQTLITPDLALAFDIPTSNSPPTPSLHHQPPQTPSAEFDSVDIGGGGDEPARTLKRPRLVWTPPLHKRFVDAVAHLGIKNAVPKTIMQLMSVDGLTRENVASHLQKYRLYLKRMQGLNSSSGGGTGGPISAEDQLFASAPYPHPHQYFPRPAVPDHFMPYPVAALQNRQTMAAAAAAAQQQQYYHQRQMGHFPPPAVISGGGFDHGFLSRVTPQPGPGIHRMAAAIQPPPQQEDLDSGPRGATRVLTLFPTGD